MARNEEKAQSMLNRFITTKQEEKRKPRGRRPYLSSECGHLADANRWRNEILREIGVKVVEIENEGVGEHRLRDLNDEINKLLRERAHWERRILELGGHDYSRSSKAALMTDLDGNIIAVPNPSGRGPGGYRYFGAAKKLPGVRELFDKPLEVRKRRTRYEIHKSINAGYYGYYGDEGGVLEPHEAAAEKHMRDEVVTLWHRVHRVRREAMKNVESGEVAAASRRGGEAAREVLYEEVEEEVEEGKAERVKGEEAEREFIAHVPLPDEKEIVRMVLEKKKNVLLRKYTSNALQGEQKEAKEMLNIHR